MYASRFRRVAGTAVLAFSACQAWAAPAQTSLNLNVLSVSFTDLNAADGIDPTLTVDPQSAFSLFVSPGIGGYAASKSSGSVSGNLVDPSSASLSLDNGVASAEKVGNIQRVSTTLNQDAFSDANLSNLMATHGFQEVYGQVKAYSYFTLSAHSKVTFTAQLQLDALVDAASVGNQAYLQAHPDQQINLQAFTKYSAYAMDSNGQFVGNTPDGYWSVWKDTQQTLQAGGPGMLTSATNENGGLLQMDISNDSDATLHFSLNAIAMGRSDLTVTSAVPESGTWALMALGLIGIAAAARRRSA